MTELNALAKKLAALTADDAAFVEGGGRVISQGGTPAPLSAILEEIDNTVLERTLTFALGATKLSCSVAGRRLRGIVEIEGDVPGADEIVGQIFSTEESKALDAAGSLLFELCDAAGKVWVTSGPSRPIGASSDVGISAAGLIERWHVDVDATPTPPMERFLLANAKKVTGFAHVIDGSVEEINGESEELLRIWDDQIADFRKRYKTLFAKQEGPMLICLDDVLEGKFGAALALIDEEACVFSYEPENLPVILRSWTQITA